MSNQPLVYSKKAQNKKINKNLMKIFEHNFNPLNHPINCSVRDVRSFKNETLNQWPLKSIDGQPFFYGYLNENTGLVEIYDDSVLILLNWLGSYGNCFFLDNLLINNLKPFNEDKIYERKKKNDQLNKQSNSSSTTSGFLSNPSNLFELNEDSYRHNLYINILNESFKEFGKLNLNELVNQIYGSKKGSKKDHLNSDLKEDLKEDFKKANLKNNYLKRIELNNFESTFKELKKSFNQNFIDRTEYILKLDLEEAFFLKQVFGILSVQEFVNNKNETNGNQKTSTNINLINLWAKCVELNKQINQCFITKYAAYFYFRSKSFIVKNGTKFGADFVLYSQNPTFVHSTYSVLLIKKSTDETDDQKLKFHNVQAFMRMTKCVAKVNQ